MTGPAENLRLRFADRALERAYWSSYLAQNLHQIRVALGIGLCLYTAFGILLRIRLDLPSSDTILRFVVAVPLIAVTVYLSFRPGFGRYWRPLIAVTLYVAAAVIAIGWARTPAVRTTWFLAGTLLLIAFAFTFSRIGFVAATLTGIGIVLTFNTLASATDRMAPLDQFFASFFLFAMLAIGSTTSFLLERSSRRLFVQGRELDAERARGEELLLNTFPRPVVDRLKAEPTGMSDSNPEVSVVFADLVDFTSHAADLSPEAVVEVLGEVFGRIDELTARFGLEKIKTVGDAYMAVAGAPVPRPDHVEAAADFALAILDAVPAMSWPSGDPIRVRIGMACGPVVSGIIGQERYAYDLWGDTVNVASRLESNGVPDRVQVSDAVHDRLGEEWKFSEPHQIVLKGKGPTRAWFLLGREPRS